MSQNGQTHFKNHAVNVARFLKCVWPFWDIMHQRVKYERMMITFFGFSAKNDFLSLSGWIRDKAHFPLAYPFFNHFNPLSANPTK